MTATNQVSQSQQSVAIKKKLWLAKTVFDAVNTTGTADLEIDTSLVIASSLSNTSKIGELMKSTDGGLFIANASPTGNIAAGNTATLRANSGLDDITYDLDPANYIGRVEVGRQVNSLDPNS